MKICPSCMKKLSQTEVSRCACRACGYSWKSTSRETADGYRLGKQDEPVDTTFEIIEESKESISEVVPPTSNQKGFDKSETQPALIDSAEQEPPTQKQPAEETNRHEKATVDSPAIHDPGAEKSAEETEELALPSESDEVHFKQTVAADPQELDTPKQQPKSAKKSRKKKRSQKQKTKDNSRDGQGDKKSTGPEKKFPTITESPKVTIDKSVKRPFLNEPTLKSDAPWVTKSDPFADPNMTIAADEQSAAADSQKPADQNIGSRTVDSKSDDDDLGANSSPHVWETIASPDAGPKSTIAAPEPGSQKNKRTLSVDSIQRRSLSDGERGVPSSGILPDYEIVRFLGEGGMGEVFVARQSTMQRSVAIKMLKEARQLRQKDRQKFLYEALVTGNLDHPNIVPIHEVGISEKGAMFYSMKWVNGKPWEDVFKKKSLWENIDILKSVADAISFSHSREIIHRDLKPENIMIGEFGEVLVMDWGLAADLTEGRILALGGTPAYMPPEMALNNVEKIGKWSDIYLLGAILFEVVTGEPPHPGDTVTDCVNAAAANEIVEHNDKDPLIQIALKAMQKKVEDRYESVQEFQEALSEYQTHSESVTIADRGHLELDKAIDESNYECFSRAIFAFQDAIDLWQDNGAAHHGLAKARVGYAQAALENNDFDLGLKQVNPEKPEEEELYRELKKASDLQKSKIRRFRLMGAAAIGFLIFGVLATVAGILFYKNASDKTKKALANLEIQQQETFKQKIIAQGERDEANEQRLITDKQKKIAQDEKVKAEQQKKIAQDEKVKAEQQKKIAEQQEDIALKNAKEAKSQSEVAKFRELHSELNLAVTHIRSGRVNDCFKMLQRIHSEKGFKDEWKGWELDRLFYLCHLDSSQLEIGKSTSLAVSRNGKNIAVANSAGSIQLFRTDRSPARFPNFQLPATRRWKKIKSIDWSPDGKLIAAGALGPKSNNVFVWSYETGKLVAQWEAHGLATIQVKFVGDTGQLMTLGVADTPPFELVKFWDLKRLVNKPTVPLAQPPNPSPQFDGIANGQLILSVDISRDFQKLVALQKDGSCAVWSTKKAVAVSVDNKNLRRSPLHELKRKERYTAVRFDPESPIGNRLIVAYGNGLVGRLSADGPKNQQPKLLPKTEEIKSKINAIDFYWNADRPNKTMISASAFSGMVTVWNSKTELPIELRGHRGSVVDGKFISTNQLVSISEREESSGTRADGVARIWKLDDIQDQTQLVDASQETSVQKVAAAAISSSGKILVADNFGNMTMWDRSSQKAELNWSIGQRLGAKTATRFLRKPNWIVSLSDRGQFRTWDANTKLQKSNLKIETDSANFAISEDARYLVTFRKEEPKIVDVYEVESGERIAEIAVRGWRDSQVAAASSVELTSDGRSLIIGTVGRGLGVYDLRTGKETWHLPFDPRYSGPARSVHSIKAIPGTNRFLTTMYGATLIDVWSVEDGIAKREFQTMGSKLASLMIDEVQIVDKRPIAILRRSTDDKSIVSLWDVSALDRTSKSLAQQIFRRPVYASSFASEKNSLALSTDKGVEVWDWQANTLKSSPQFAEMTRQLGLAKSSTGKYPKMTSLWESENRQLMAGSGYVYFSNRDETKSKSDELAIAPNPACLSACVSSDGQVALTLHSDQMMRVWECKEGQKSAQLKMQFSTKSKRAELFPGGGRALILDAEGSLVSFLIDREKVGISTEVQQEQFVKGIGSVSNFAISKNGKNVVVQLSSGEIQLYSSAGEVLAKVAVKELFSKLAEGEFEPSMLEKSVLCIDDSGTRLAVGLGDQFVIGDFSDRNQVLDPKRWIRFDPAEVGGVVTTLKFNQLGNRLLVGRTNGLLSIYGIHRKLSDLSTVRIGEELSARMLDLNFHRSPILQAEFSQDQSTILTAAENEPPVIWPSSQFPKDAERE